MKKKIVIPLIIIAALALGCRSQQNGPIVAQGVLDATILTLKSQVAGTITLAVAPGQAVKKGDLLVQIDRQKLETQLESLALERRDVALSRDTLKTSISLISRQLAYLSRQDERFKRLVAAESLPAEKKESMELQKLQAETQLFEQRKRLEQLDLTEEKLAVKEKQLQLQLADHVLYAPKDATVLDTHIESGETAFPGVALLDLLLAERFTIDIFLEEAELAKIVVGGPATVRLDGSDKRLSATIETISRSAEFSSKYIISEKERSSLLFKVTLSLTPDEMLKVGQPATVELTPSKG